MNTNFSSNMSVAPVVGYRFHPTDEELIINYLEPKIRNGESQNPIIDLVDMSKVEPWDLPALAKIKSKDLVWYFFCRNTKFMGSKRSNRRTKGGHWKATGKPRLIKARCTKKIIGSKRTLVYYLGRSKKNRTKWVMHEYECRSDSSVTKQQQGEFVLCKLKKKADEKHEKDKTNHHHIGLAFDYENRELNEMNSMTSMPSHDIGEPNQFMSFDSTNQNILETTTTSDLVCDRSDMSFHLTSFIDISSPSGMYTNTTQEVDMSNHHIALAFDYENWELDEINSMTSMPSHDIGEPNQFISFDSTNQNILETTTTSDLACDRSDMSFHGTSLIDISSPSGMDTNTTQEVDVDVSNLENPNLDKQDSISASTGSDQSMHLATSSANIGTVGQQEKVDDVSSVDGLMASDFLIDIEDDICKMDDVWALVDSMCEQEETGNFNP